MEEKYVPFNMVPPHIKTIIEGQLHHLPHNTEITIEIIEEPSYVQENQECDSLHFSISENKITQLESFKKLNNIEDADFEILPS